MKSTWSGGQGLCTGHHIIANRAGTSTFQHLIFQKFGSVLTYISTSVFRLEVPVMCVSALNTCLRGRTQVFSKYSRSLSLPMDYVSDVFGHSWKGFSDMVKSVQLFLDEGAMLHVSVSNQYPYRHRHARFLSSASIPEDPCRVFHLRTILSTVITQSSLLPLPQVMVVVQDSEGLH